MKQKLLLPLLALLLFLAPQALFATHNRAGEIHVAQIGPLKVRATIITWTKPAASMLTEIHWKSTGATDSSKKWRDPTMVDKANPWPMT